jgi:hypothetical protein
VYDYFVLNYSAVIFIVQGKSNYFNMSLKMIKLISQFKIYFIQHFLLKKIMFEMFEIWTRKCFVARYLTFFVSRGSCTWRYCPTQLVVLLPHSLDVDIAPRLWFYGFCLKFVMCQMNIIISTWNTQSWRIASLNTDTVRVFTRFITTFKNLQKYY